MSLATFRLIALIFLGELLVLAGVLLAEYGPDGTGNWTASVALSTAALSALGVLLLIRPLRPAARYAVQAINSTRDGYWVLNSRGSFIEINQSYCRMMGYSQAELMKMEITDLEDAVSQERIREQIQRIFQSGHQRFETRHRHKLGHWVSLEITVTAVNLHYLVAFLRDVTERKAAEARIHQMAYYDELTGLPNRRLLQDQVQQALDASAFTGEHAALLLVDLDNFKFVNDTRGHAAGDQLLLQVSQRLQQCLRPGDTLARWGGDEFVLLLEYLGTDADLAATSALQLAEACQRALETPLAVAEQQVYVSASMGLTTCCGDALPVSDILQQVDTAMYRAKAAGRNRIERFRTQMTQDLARRARMVNELRAALQQEQFCIHLQPQYAWNASRQSLHLMGAEALVRWAHPERGLIGPQEFLAATEDTGLIHPLGAWVLAQACQVLQRWQASDSTRHLQLAVNVSALQFGAGPFVQTITSMLHSMALTPGSLHLELTESLAVQDMDDVIQKLQSLRRIGVQLSMDDFGTGQSSLTNLRRLPFNQVKIDKSFVGNLANDRSDEAVVRTVVVMAQTLGLDVIAEGVETPQQLQALTEMGCMKFQGYLFSPPVASADFDTLIAPDLQPQPDLLNRSSGLALLRP